MVPAPRGDRRWLTPSPTCSPLSSFPPRTATPDLRTDLLASMGGIVRNIHGKLMDSNASLGVPQTWHRAAFAWQVGYGAFSVSPSNVPAVVKYIRDQEQHHRKISLQEEFLAFLKRIG